MKLCSLVVTLLFITISGMEYSRHHHHPLFKNPQAFVSSLNQIDTDQITKMKGMVNDLIQGGEDERAIVTASRDAGQTDLNLKEDLRVAAVGAEADALKLVTDGEANLVTLEGLEVEAKKLQAEDKITMDNAGVDMNEAEKVMNNQNERIDGEKETLEEVKTLISEISGKAFAEKNKGRNLLNVVDYKALMNADPDSIQDVVNLVDDLIEAGETERAGYIADWDTAVGIFNNAKDTYEQSFEAWEISWGKVERQGLDNDAARIVHEQKTTEQLAATALKNEATAELKRRQDHLDVETVRLDGEKKTCEDVIALLDELLAE